VPVTPTRRGHSPATKAQRLKRDRYRKRIAARADWRHSSAMARRFWNFACSLLLAGVAVALLAGSSLAQLPAINLDPDARPKRVLTPEEQEKQKALDEKYKSTMQSIPDKKAPVDPWGSVRNAPSSGVR
jgi:hypothetical protein